MNNRNIAIALLVKKIKLKKTVLKYFYDKGAEPVRMTATGHEDTFPLAMNDTAPERAKNRRVEFVLEKE